MDTGLLKKFAQEARRTLQQEVSTKLDWVLKTDSAELRENVRAVEGLKKEIEATSRDAVVEKAAYTWFNRFCALRFMDLKGYTRMGIVSPAPEQSQPEILAEAKMGHIDDRVGVSDARVRDLLSGRIPSRDAEGEAYRLLFVAVCNDWNPKLPFLFERIADWTELLMPEDLLSEKSLLHRMRGVLTEATCQDVEVIGWLYQFYISEKKDAVFAALKNNQKIEAENIPAATQLFTPNWIVRYLVENSLGRLWMQNHPESNLADRMAYYIPDESGQVPVISDQLQGDAYGEKLQEIDYMAEVDRPCGAGVSSQQDISKRGYLCTDESASQGSSLHFIEHSSGFFGGGGNSSYTGSTPSLSIGSRNTDGVSTREEDQQNAGISQKKMDRCQRTTDYLKVSSPEEIRICDPACGSGHMLVYAFELLVAIYEEEGYAPKEIPGLILEKNLVGIEIDPRAGSLAAFALVMKACETHRRFIRKPVRPTICVLKSIHFSEAELDSYMKAVGNDLLTHNLRLTLEQFADADHFGSLIRPMLDDPTWMAGHLEETVGEDMFLRNTHMKVLDVLGQAEALASKYHVVVANPPYMGGKGMNTKMKDYLQKHYKDVKSDLFSAFIVRNLDMAQPMGQLGFMTPFVWMFISSYEKLRAYLIEHKTLTSLVQLEYSGFDGATVPICTFTLENSHKPNFKGGYVRLSDFKGSANQSPKTLEIIGNYKRGLIKGKSESEKQDALSAALPASSTNPTSPLPSNFFRASASDFQKIPGAPIAYWATKNIIQSFERNNFFENFGETLQGMTTCDNDFYLRFWWEVDQFKIGTDHPSRESAKASGKKWFPYTKGGTSRKWFGNNEYVVNWLSDGELLRTRQHPTIDKIWAHNFNLDYIFKKGASFSSLSSGTFSCRYTPNGFLFDQKGSMIFVDDDIESFMGLFNSKLTTKYLELLCPTLDFNPGALLKIPIANDTILNNELPQKAIQIAKYDWNNNEYSHDFSANPMLTNQGQRASSINMSYRTWLETCRKTTLSLHNLEKENNRIFIEAYGLQDELTPDVSLNQITLTCNPHYRYGNKKTDEELETLLLSDTMKEFISYAVGCMFGRYSLNKPGLILANQGDTLSNYIRKVTEPSDNETKESKHSSLTTGHCPPSTDLCPLTPENLSFTPDDDNVIPILEEGWFTDDITERFHRFLKVTFGEEHFDENLAFLETVIGKSVRKYFLADFYTDHVKRYKKRPIYWMFESPKKSFRCLIYMHRYQPDTVSVFLNDYLRDYHSKLTSRMQHLESVEASASASKAEKAKSMKEMDKIRKILMELEAWERDVIFPMAGRQIDIDLDDGVKVNYRKFDGALKKITGL